MKHNLTDNISYRIIDVVYMIERIANNMINVPALITTIFSLNDTSSLVLYEWNERGKI